MSARSMRVGWRTLRFKRCAVVRNGQVDPRGSAFRSLPLFAPNHIESGTGRLFDVDSAEAQGAESGKYLVQRGDVLYSKIRPALAKVAIASMDGLCSADMYAIYPRAGVDARFLMWAMLSDEFTHSATMESERVAMPKINRESLAEIDVRVPGIEEQRRIAAFLDARTAAIDAAVAEHENALAKLAEQRQSLISHAVTRGIGVSGPTPDNRLLPSGWRLVRLKQLVASIEQGWSPQCEGRPAERGEWGVLKVGCVNDEAFDPEENKALPPELTAPPEYVVQDGDLLMSRANTRELVGSVALARTEGRRLLLCDKLFRLHLRGALLREFAHLTLRAEHVRRQIEAGATGASASMVNITHAVVRELAIPLPPLDEQRAIVAHLRERTAAIDDAADAARRAIALLREYRQSLVTAAVTGRVAPEEPRA